MDARDKTISQVSYPKGKSSSISELSHVIYACECSKSLMTAIYLIDSGSFLYCNDKLQEIFGTHYQKLIVDGWDFWYTLIVQKDLATVKNQLYNFFTPPYPQELLTLRYHITKATGSMICMKHEILLHQLEKNILAINYFFDITEKERIEQCFESKPSTSRLRKKQILTVSPREKQVLRLIADGYSSKEIADMLFISNHTAISHRKNLIEKFQVKNTAHLIKKAFPLICL